MIKLKYVSRSFRNNVIGEHAIRYCIAKNILITIRINVYLFLVSNIVNSVEDSVLGSIGNNYD